MMNEQLANPMMNHQQDTGSLRDFLTVLFKHRTKILAIFLVTVATVTIGSFLMSPVYEAESSILVKFGRENIYRPEVGDKSPMISINQEEAINSEINILTSRDLMEKVITTLTVEKIYPELLESPPSAMTPLQAAMLIFEKKLAAEGIKKSNVIKVSFQHKDPRIAANVVNMLVDFYKEKHLEVYSEPQSSFLEKQLGEYDQKLKQSENTLQAFRQKNQVYSLDEQRSLLLKQRMELDTDLKNMSNHTEQDKVITDAKAKLLDLQLKEQGLLQKYKESSRLVVGVRKEKELVAVFLRQQEAAITRKMNSGRVKLAQVDKEIQSLDLNEIKNQELKREVSNNDKNYRTYVDKLEDARISDDMNRQKMVNVSVIQAATIPAKPIKPKKALNILLGIILGAVSGLGYAFFSEYTSQGLSTPESVEKRLGLPVLTTIAYKK